MVHVVVDIGEMTPSTLVQGEGGIYLFIYIILRWASQIVDWSRLEDILAKNQIQTET